MKHFSLYTYSICLVISLFLAGAGLVMAQDDASSSPERAPGEMRENMQDRMEENKEAFQERRAEFREAAEERKGAIQERVQNRITNLAHNVRRLMEAAITRLEHILNRMESRAEKLTERGVATDEAFDYLALASNEINSAKASLTSIDELVELAITSDTPREDFKAVKIRFGEARDALKQTREHLRNALQSLKDSVAETTNGVSDAVSNENATSSDESNEESNE